MTDNLQGLSVLHLTDNALQSLKLVESDMNKVDLTIDSLINLTKQYGGTYRASINPQQYSRHPEVSYDSEAIKESLISHVGHLPIVATVLFPHIQNPEVDLGRALVMLAVHDIGETVTGDIMMFAKTAADTQHEDEIAYGMLEGDLLAALKDFNDLEDDSAKFAKSCDKLVADILEFLIPAEVSIARYLSLVGIDSVSEIISMKRQKKMQYMLWNPFLAELYDRLLERLQSYLES